MSRAARGCISQALSKACVLRRKLEQALADEGAQALYRRLCELDPDYAKTVHPNHTSRVLRALEVCMLTGGTVSRQLASSLPEQPPYDARIWALNADTREALYRNIDRRVDAMLQAGLLREARWVYDNRQRFSTAAQAIGYKELKPFLDGELPPETAVENLKRATRRYAKRQITWFKRNEAIHWLYPDACPSNELFEQALDIAKAVTECPTE